MRGVAGVVVLLAVGGLALAQGGHRQWPVSTSERLALETLDARQRALEADREALAREVAGRLGINRANLCLDGKAGVWFEGVAPVRS